MKKIRSAFVGALGLCLLVVVCAPAANAAPAPGFEMFAGCPDTPDPGFCIRSDTTAGHLKIGSTDTPISHTVTMSGGVTQDGSLVATPLGGLIHEPLEVPGGLTGLTGLSEFIVNLITFGANRVYAQSQLVGQPKVGETINLPIRVKLINPFLTSTCGIGSAASPITLKMTTGTTAPPAPAKPITGREGTQMADPKNPLILLAKDSKLVDNSFSAPAASGCDLLGFGLINALVNARAGLPSAAGKNEAIFDHTDVRIGFKENVYP